MNLKELVQKISEIKSMGFIKTHRLNDTGIGKTLVLCYINFDEIECPDLRQFQRTTTQAYPL